MPQTPLLPIMDWRSWCGRSQSWDDWLVGAAIVEERARLLDSHRNFTPSPAAVAFLQRLPVTVHVLALAEGWCGDVVRHVPVLQRLAETAPKLKAHYIDRQRGLPILERHLTNGGEAIPKLIFLSAAFIETGHWGPMPATERELIARGKAAADPTGARRLVKARYDADPERREVERELLELIDIAATTQIAGGTVAGA